MLSISYIITELFLLGLHMIVKENERLKQMVALQAAQPPKIPEAFTQGLTELTQTERTIYGLYLDGKSTKEVLETLSITENTLKFHNKNIYSKLGISSRKQLLRFAALKQHQQSTKTK